MHAKPDEVPICFERRGPDKQFLRCAQPHITDYSCRGGIGGMPSLPVLMRFTHFCHSNCREEENSVCILYFYDHIPQKGVTVERKEKLDRLIDKYIVNHVASPPCPVPVGMLRGSLRTYSYRRLCETWNGPGNRRLARYCTGVSQYCGQG